MFFMKVGYPTVDSAYRTKPINQEPFYVSPHFASLTRLHTNPILHHPHLLTTTI